MCYSQIHVKLYRILKTLHTSYPGHRPKPEHPAAGGDAETAGHTNSQQLGSSQRGWVQTTGMIAINL